MCYALILFFETPQTYHKTRPLGILWTSLEECSNYLYIAMVRFHES